MTRKTLIILAVFLSFTYYADAEGPIPQKLVSDAFNHLRGLASISTLNMTIHRPEWQRTVTLKAWTLGETDSLIVITAPSKDNGNGTLKKGNQMWMFNPKVNRVIKLPPSMMSQAWQGSDFSNNDLAKSDTLINDYTHTLVDTRTHEGKKVFVIKSMPKPDAPVVWGMLKLKIREDLIFLSEEFYDEDLEPVKIMTCYDIGPFGDRLFPQKWKMKKSDAKDEYTLLEYKTLEFKKSLSNSTFTLSNLKNPRR